MRLPERQLAVLEAASATDERTVAEIAAETDLKPETVAGAAFDLADEGLVEVGSVTDRTLALTDEGRRYVDEGLPETRLYRAGRDAGADADSVSMGAVIGEAALDGPEVDIALANFARKGYGSVDGGELSVDPDADPDDAEATALAALAEADADGESLDGDALDVDEAVIDRLDSRGLIAVGESVTRTVRLTDEGVDALMTGVEATETVGALTPELLASGEWRDAEFAAYNVEAEAETARGGRKHVLRRTADRVKDVLVGMGFQEMEGPHADADFWINDCLFMPQDHPARTHWDRFALDVDRMESISDELMARVESAHRDGWGDDGDGYHSPWSEEFAREVALRGHTTSLSMRYLSGVAGAELEPPQRYFSVEKVYRNDTLDPTHLLEFFQIEGWVMAEDLSVRDLMGTFEEFYRQFGITDIRFKPHYNPYTEPSFELFGEHPETGEEIEIGNSGVFREEVTGPLGVDCDVMAWGLALERLAMLTTGAEDIRDLHGTLADIEFLRDAEVSY
ncbi:phenylalanyl--tRNA ligase subunit alpha [Halorubrum ezzemoulense DSM 17463]|uniref:Phenylalanine--tRNA ligase alpha subunit n=2 Tax=Halorubrum ezzemoulense TaxID=337243 RepID=A0A1X4GKJ0_HALEZ|nr:MULTISPECIES: phenylalanine--tRNA ligase subunit alpha [Halorubrum]OSO97547.1 phenylalanyl--tRNA ligase subunit alpha [Halorubrum ezzemoulense DSM 17463]OYR76421.1 phenylalanyl--tRNA ligase subunit alpha [Halorubrum ezzemoulense]OYR81574.1 phenylalanyl--tRNA ligase subunit alpha [Halorubrum ezzemoulense]PHQ43607.1 phenylalanyl--tRNA ligase subunit alpha [Halorubrum sp. C191]QAY21189.1 phenylalanine--tRNA ligase subunit alpha [Halorubrum ezzemoulense]